MMKKKMMFGAALLVGAMMASCSQNTDFVGQTEEGEGQLFLTLGADAGFTKTRALSEAAYANTSNYTVVIADKDGIERVRCQGGDCMRRPGIASRSGRPKAGPCRRRAVWK